MLKMTLTGYDYNSHNSYKKIENNGKFKKI